MGRRRKKLSRNDPSAGSGSLIVLLVLLVLALISIDLIIEGVSFIKYDRGFLVFSSRKNPYHASYLNENALAVDIVEENNVPTPPAVKDKAVFSGPEDKKLVALTFDADMTPGMKKELESGAVRTFNDQRVADVLEKTNTKATFFMAGMWIEEYQETAVRMAGSPLFELANHSYSHPGFDGTCYGLSPIPDSDDKQEILKTQELLRKVAGIESKYFRFPGGCYSKTDLEIVEGLGLTAIMWDVAARDGFNQNTKDIIDNVVRNVKNGSIVVLHLGGATNAPKTADALPYIISSLRQKGFEFVKLSELLEKPRKITLKDFIRYL